jgi:hypothetical protein
MRATRLVPALLCLLLAACGGRTLVVESDTEWSGTLDAYGNISGRGTARYELDARGLTGSSGQTCWSVTKTTEAGTLHAYVEESTWFGLGNQVSAESVTKVPNGVVGGCV